MSYRMNATFCRATALLLAACGPDRAAKACRSAPWHIEPRVIIAEGLPCDTCARANPRAARARARPRDPMPPTAGLMSRVVARRRTCRQIDRGCREHKKQRGLPPGQTAAGLPCVHPPCPPCVRVRLDDPCRCCCVQRAYQSSPLDRGDDDLRAARDRGDRSTEIARSPSKGFSFVDMLENVIGVDIDGDGDKGQGYGLVDGLETVHDSKGCMLAGPLLTPAREERLMLAYAC